MLTSKQNLLIFPIMIVKCLSFQFDLPKALVNNNETGERHTLFGTMFTIQLFPFF